MGRPYHVEGGPLPYRASGARLAFYSIRVTFPEHHRYKGCPSSSKVNLKSHDSPVPFNGMGVSCFAPVPLQRMFAAQLAISSSGFVCGS